MNHRRAIAALGPTTRRRHHAAPGPAWHLDFLDTFSRDNGPPGNGWVDRLSAWAISAGHLGSGSNDYPSALLTRPAAEWAGRSDQRATATVAPIGPGLATPIIWARADPANRAGYATWAGDNGSTLLLIFARFYNGAIVATHNVDASALGGLAALALSIQARGAEVEVSAGLPGSAALLSFTVSDATIGGGTPGLSALAPPNRCTGFAAESYR